jgi:hypothetical protein
MLSPFYAGVGGGREDLARAIPKVFGNPNQRNPDRRKNHYDKSFDRLSDEHGNLASAALEDAKKESKQRVADCW